MGYNFLYSLCFLILMMFLLRIFLPFLIYLIPVFLVVYIIKALSRKKKTNNSTYEETYYHQDTYNQPNQSSNPDIIDVDYKVVDEEDHNTH